MQKAAVAQRHAGRYARGRLDDSTRVLSNTGKALQGRLSGFIRAAQRSRVAISQGLAHCFEKAEHGKLKDKFVIEPITANSLECMAAGMPSAI